MVIPENHSKTSELFDFMGCLAIVLAAAFLDARFGWLGVSACLYAFLIFTGWDRIRRHRYWLVPTVLFAIAAGGTVHRRSDPWLLFRVSLALCSVAVMAGEMIASRRRQREVPELDQGEPSNVSNDHFFGRDFSDRGMLQEPIVDGEEDSANRIGLGPIAGQNSSGPAGDDETAMYSKEGEEAGAVDHCDFDSVPVPPTECHDPRTLLRRLRASAAFDEATLAKIAEIGRRCKDPMTQLPECVRAGLLTRFQLECIRTGRERDLKVGRYTVRSVLGRGAMGVVYRAFDRQRDRDVALKMFRNPREHLARIRREMNVLEELAHPNIVIALEVGEAEGRQFIAMEYVEGETLDQIVKRAGCVPIATAIHVMLQVAVALQQAHGRGILHRDIKPGNIMITSTGASKLLDLGVSLPPEELREFETVELQGPLVCGTVGFMSPEQAIGRDKLDARSDLFSLGSTLFFLLSGKLLIKGESVEARLANTRRASGWRPIELPDAPPLLGEMLARLTDPDPEQRYQTAGELLPDLRRLAREIGIMTDDSQVHVLIVEDTNTDLILTRRLLERSNRSLEIHHAPDYAAATDAIWVHTESSRLPLIVLLDLSLPDSEIAETVDRIRELASDQVHVITLTGLEEGHLRERCLENGAVECLSKETVTSQTLERAIFATFGRLPASHRIAIEL